MRDKYLPIGSVVNLKNNYKKIMITGFFVIPNNKKKIYDYCGVLYPEGYLTNKQLLLFNHDIIDKIHFVGYECEEETNYKIKFNELIKDASMINPKAFNNEEYIEIFE